MAKEIGQRIRNARVARSMSQAHLAEAANLDIRTIRRIEKGENPPSHESLLSICLVLKLDAENLKQESDAALRPKAKAEMVFVSDGHALLQNLVGFHDGAVDADDAGEDEEAASLVKEVIQSLEFAEIMPEVPQDATYEQGRALTRAIQALEAKGWVVAVMKKLDVTIEWAGQSIPHWNRVVLVLKNANRPGHLTVGKPTRRADNRLRSNALR
jgi:transcriptional regulator with XRE-family HTH domain